MTNFPHIVGIDGCKNGWVAVSISTTGVDIFRAQTLEFLMETVPTVHVILIDMPIGLATSIGEDTYRPEKLARKYIPKKASSIFKAPAEQAAYCTTYAEANEVNRNILGKGLSKQSYHICKKIREVDIYVKTSTHGEILMESHPEVCFARLHPSREPILENKQTSDGRKKRLEVLHIYNPEVVSEVESAFDISKDLQGIADDVIDAACLAIVAKRGVKDGFRTIPKAPQKNRHGIPMQMVYYENSSNSDQSKSFFL